MTVQHDDDYDAALYYQPQQQYRQFSPSWQILSPFGYRYGVQLASPWMQAQAQGRQTLRASSHDPYDGYDVMESRREQGRRRCDQQAFVPIQRPPQQLQQSGQQQPLPQAYRDSSSSRQPTRAPSSAAASRAAAPADLLAHTNCHLQAAGQQRTTPSPATQQQASTRAAGAAPAPVRSLGADSQPRYRAALLQVLQGASVDRPGCLTAPTPHRDQAKPAAATGAGTPLSAYLLPLLVPLATSVLASANGAWRV